MDVSTTTGPQETAPEPARPSRSILLIAGIVIGIVVVAVLVVLAASRPPATYPAGSPEATIQGFLTANDEDDVEAAYAFFSESVRGSLTVSEYRRLWTDFSWQREEDRRVVLEQTDMRDTRATVHLRVDVYSGGGPFGSSRYTYERSVGLVREDDAWRIDELLVGLEPVGYKY